ncbi:hypothetical protein, partial [Immundisolibacter sp.]|uniref:hypothetical protein n=1 Tax=Immundisolibacter sp. TaxID=1934948 RepID=UPI003562A741
MRQHASAVSFVARGLDASAVVLAGWVAAATRLGTWVPPERYQVALLLGALLTLVVFPVFGVYQS